MGEIMYDVGKKVSVEVRGERLNGTLFGLNCENEERAYAQVDDQKVYIKEIKGGRIEADSDDIRLAIQNG